MSIFSIVSLPETVFFNKFTNFEVTVVFSKTLGTERVVDSFVGRKYERRRKKGAGAGTAPALQDGAQQPHGSSTSCPSNV